MPLLTRPDVDRYLALRFGAHRFPAELSARIHDRTEGNPLFVADLVRFLRDRGVLVESDGQWVVSGDLAQVEEDLPESIRSMVQKKIGDLTAAERRLMSAAAVLGPRFESAIVARALGVEAEEIEDRLEALDRLRGFVRRIEERILPDSTVSVEYGFVHVLYQNALHDALTPARKAALSLTLAEALLAGHPGHTGPVASRLALLFEAGRDFARASDFFLVAAQNAGRMYAADQAIALARRSIENAARLEGAARESRVMAAALHSAAQHQSATRLAAAAADFEVAERAAQALDDPVAEVDAIFGQANVCFVAKRIPEVKALGLRAMAIARTSGRPAAVAASTAILAFERVCTGDVSVGERQFDEAIPVLRESGKVNQALSAVLMRGLLRTWRLEHAGADADLEWARATAAERKAPFELLLALWHQARARGNQGRLSDAWDLLDEGLRLADLLGDRFCRPRIANTRGWILAELLDTEAALRLDTEAVRVARECADVEAECNSRINAARDYLALAEPQNALVHLQDAEARYQNEAWFRWVYYPRLHAELGAYWLAQGDLGRAETSARISLDGAGRTSSRKRIVSAHKLLGDIALLEDRPADARREFAAALAVLERHRCPTLEWHVLRSAAGAAAALDGDQARHDMLARSRSVVRSLAGSIRHPDLEATFLRSQPIRDLLSGSAF
jgi:tetratricopeptide (TPR) repeat protein